MSALQVDASAAIIPASFYIQTYKSPRSQLPSLQNLVLSGCEMFCVFFNNRARCVSLSQTNGGRISLQRAGVEGLLTVVGR